MVKIGIIGAGLMGNQYGTTLAAMPDVQVVGVSSRTRDKAEALASRLGARVYDDYRDLIDAVDAVWVCTPDFLHREFSVAALEANKHLFVEKALATSPDDGYAIVQAEEKARAANPSLKAMVGYPMQFRPQFNYARRLLNELGEEAVMAWSMRTHFLTEGEMVYDRGRDEHYFPPEWYFDRARGKGPIFSHCSHDYNILMSMCGPVKSVIAQGDTYLLKKGDVADAFAVLLRFENGAVATVSTPWVTRVDYDIIGVATPSLTVVNNNGEIRLRRAGESEERVTFAPFSVWETISRHFIDCIRNDSVPLVSIRDGFQTMLVAEAAFRSLYEGTEVFVSELEKEVAA